MARAPDLPKVSQIFLSATAQDCREYRAAVKASVERNVAAAKVFLQENWAEGGRFVVDVCRQKVKSCHAYMGLFGHRYGWVPAGFKQSITELEFGWAVERWPQGTVPIFVLLPVKGSEADKELLGWARPWIEKECPDEKSRDEEAHSQRAFLASVTAWSSNGPMLTFYGNQQELTEKAHCSILNWNLFLYEEALAGRRQAQGEIPAHELGRIGCEAQQTALIQALDAFREHPRQRAIAFLVHGPENHGQREFAEFLYRWKDEWEGYSVYDGQPADPDSIVSLICWACGQLQQPVLGAAGIDALAEVLAARLARSSVVFVQRTVGLHPDRLATFQGQFWQPLLTALAKRSSGGKGRLYWFVIEHEQLAKDPGPGIRIDALDADDVDYSQFLALPALGDIDAQQVQRWLRELKTSGIISLDADRRREIAKYATQPDGSPPNVYNRLVLNGFWASAN